MKLLKSACRPILRWNSAARTDVVTAVAHFEMSKEYVSREIAVRILEEAEEHIDFLETELGLIELVGLNNYLQSQIGEEKSQD